MCKHAWRFTCSPAFQADEQRLLRDNRTRLSDLALLELWLHHMCHFQVSNIQISPASREGRGWNVARVNGNLPIYKRVPSQWQMLQLRGHSISAVMQYGWCCKGQGQSWQIILPRTRHIKMKWPSLSAQHIKTLLENLQYLMAGFASNIKSLENPPIFDSCELSISVRRSQMYMCCG